MRTLYVSDLDGTLLRSDERTSEFTNQTINELVEKGMFFSYATARSYHTAHKVTKGLDAKIPLIVYNGAFVMDNMAGEILVSHYFDIKVKDLLADLMRHDIYPIVYAYINGIEKCSFVDKLCTLGAKEFIQSRKGDQRLNSVQSINDLYQGDIFYISCIDVEEKLHSFYKKYQNQYHCVYQKDIYTHDQWLEIMPLEVSKANAIQQLKQLLNCDCLITFGDGLNDIDMFELADECYAVENAVEELKQIATGVIASHNDDGVAKWLQNNIKSQDYT